MPAVKSSNSCFLRWPGKGRCIKHDWSKSVLQGPRSLCVIRSVGGTPADEPHAKYKERGQENAIDKDKSDQRGEQDAGGYGRNRVYRAEHSENDPWLSACFSHVPPAECRHDAGGCHRNKNLQKPALAEKTPVPSQPKRNRRNGEHE